MSKTKYRQCLGAGVLAVTFMALFTGCKDLLIFSTATKFGLDISESSAQQPEINFGYNRVEVVSIPLGGTNSAGTNGVNVRDAGATSDAYSVVGTVTVAFDPRININIFSSSNAPYSTNAGLHVNDLFVTGMAAQQAAANPVMGAVFGTNLLQIKAAKNNSSNN